MIQKALMLSYGSRLEHRKTTLISPLPNVNVALKNDSTSKISFVNNNTSTLFIYATTNYFRS